MSHVNNGKAGEGFSAARFGSSRSFAGSSPTDHLFTGQVADSSTGLYFYGARYYSSALGRFLQPDALAQARPSDKQAYLPLSVAFSDRESLQRLNESNRGGQDEGQPLLDPQLLNRYSYARNEPLNYTDSSGHFLDWLWDWAPIAFDIYTFREEPSWENAGYLGLDIVLGVVPGIPAGAGLVAKAGKVTAKALEVNTAVSRAVRLVGHHTVPTEILKSLPRNVAGAAQGKKGAKNIWKIPEDVHVALHEGPGGGIYNNRFIEELDKIRIGEGRQPNAEDVLRIRDNLVKEFKLEQYRP